MARRKRRLPPAPAELEVLLTADGKPLWVRVPSDELFVKLPTDVVRKYRLVEDD